MREIFNLEKLLTIFDYVFWFFLLNIFFMFMNLPLIFFILSVGIYNISTYLPLFLLCLVPFMPSMTVLIYCMGKLIRYKDLNLFKDFSHGLKVNFKQSFILWCIELLFILILNSNIRFFSRINNGLIFTCIFIALLIVLLLITPYIYILASRFSISNLDLIKDSFILAFTRPILTITNIFIIIVPFILFELSPGTSILFISSIFAYLISYSNKSLLEELESSSF